MKQRGWRSAEESFRGRGAEEAGRGRIYEHEPVAAADEDAVGSGLHQTAAELIRRLHQKSLVPGYFTVNVAFSVVSELVPTRMSKSPGSTTLVICGSISHSASGPIGSVTTVDCREPARPAQSLEAASPGA